MANPFFVEPANPLQALMLGQQGYDKARERLRQNEADVARQEAAKLYGAGDTQGAIGKILGAGDPRLLSALGQLQTAGGVFGNLIYGLDENGNVVVGTHNKLGQFVPIKTPGFTPTLPVKTIDTGLGTQIIPGRGAFVGGAPAPTGAAPQAGVTAPTPEPQGAPPAGIPGYIPKNVAGAAKEKKLGTEEGERLATIGEAGARLGGITAGFDNLISTATKIKNSPALERITGVMGLFPNYPSGKAADLQAEIKVLTSQTAYAVLQNMRELSKTGGAVGQVSNYETQLLSNNLATVDQLVSAGKFRDAMNQIIKYGEDAKSRLKAAYDQDYGRLQQKPSTPKGLKTRELGGKTYFQAPNGNWYEQ